MDSMNQFTYGRRERDQEAKRLGEASLIECIHFGEYEIDTWYAAPYPAEYSMNKVLWICEFCLKYMNSEYVCWRHKVGCPLHDCRSSIITSITERC
jgi:histone acetyltransferase SAS3